MEYAKAARNAKVTVIGSFAGVSAVKSQAVLVDKGHIAFLEGLHYDRERLFSHPEVDIITPPTAVLPDPLDQGLGGLSLTPEDYELFFQ